MQTGTFQKLDGEVEIDESYIGGAARFMHKSGKDRIGNPRGSTKHKTAVLGMRQRNGETRAMVVPSSRRQHLYPHIKEHIEGGTTIYTDSADAYRNLYAKYDHKTINHLERYVEGNIHTNGIENFWALLKRGLKGTYVSVKPFHLFRYVDERAFAYNRFDSTDRSRFEAVLRAVTGRRLTWAELTGATS